MIDNVEPDEEVIAEAKATATIVVLEAINEFRLYGSRAELQRLIDRYFGTVEDPIKI